MENDLVRLFDIADGQLGYFMTQQAAGVAVGGERLRTLAEERLVEPVTAGVFRIRAGGRHPFPQVYAAWLATDPHAFGWVRRPETSAVAAFETALRIHGAGGRPRQGIEFIVPVGGLAASGAPRVVLTEADLVDSDWIVMDGMPVTTPARTVCDVAAAGRVDLSDLQRAAETLLRRRVLNSKALAEAFDRQLRSGAVDGASEAWIRELVGAATEAERV